MDRNTSPIAAGSMSERPRLTEQEKKNNHIASEQKRRQAIRDGFDEIADLVPGLSGHGRSEALVLEGAGTYLKRLLADRWRLLAQAQEHGLDTRRYEMDHDTMLMAKQAFDEEQTAFDLDEQRIAKELK